MPDFFAGLLAVAFLAGLVLFVLWFTRRFEKNPIIKHLPAPLWCYFLPMLASWAGMIPHGHAVYPLLSKHLLPACLILLLMGAELKRILELGPVALFSMLAGTLAIIVGGPILFFLFKPWLPHDAWMGLGALSASWTGGSANMIAVKEAIGVPEALFSVMVIVDSIACYVWMGIVIELSSFQGTFDRWNQSKMEWLEQIGDRSKEIGDRNKSEMKSVSSQIVLLSPNAYLLIPIILGEFAIFLGQNSTGAILLATLFGIVLSFKKIPQIDEKQAEKVGYFMLYLLLASIGARADLTGIFRAPVYLLFGFLWILVMGFVLFGVGKLFRIPLFFLATASQANVGGTASATMVAAVYQPHLAYVGLLLAILGNVFGTYLGIGTSYLMKWIAGQ